MSFITSVCLRCQLPNIHVPSHSCLVLGGDYFLESTHLLLFGLTPIKDGFLLFLRVMTTSQVNLFKCCCNSFRPITYF